jgi:hypothetical protein
MDDQSTTAVAAAIPHHAVAEGVTQILALAIPIVAIVMGIGFAMFGAWLAYRRQRELFQLHHAERMAAIEKGIELPPLPPAFFQFGIRRPRTVSSNLRRGVLLLFIGIAVSIALYTGKNSDWRWGLIPAAIGLAYLLLHRFEASVAPEPGQNP